MALRVLLRFLEALEGLRYDDEEPDVPPFLLLGLHHHLGVELLNVLAEAERDPPCQPSLFPHAGIEEVSEQCHGGNYPDKRLAGVSEDDQIQDGSWSQVQEPQTVCLQDLKEKV